MTVFQKKRAIFLKTCVINFWRQSILPEPLLKIKKIQTWKNCNFDRNSPNFKQSDFSPLNDVTSQNPEYGHIYLWWTKTMQSFREIIETFGFTKKSVQSFGDVKPENSTLKTSVFELNFPEFQTFNRIFLL